MYEEKDATIKYDDGRCDKATKGDKLVVEERRDAADVSGRANQRSRAADARWHWRITGLSPKMAQARNEVEVSTRVARASVVSARGK
uniref:Uncharacterized protein G65A3.055 n=1 Tax=Neurospora crassa TaxID=5141 RepID=Q96TY1_NEUCS|nr:hypothetical protein [Neurospora crassa]